MPSDKSSSSLKNAIDSTPAHRLRQNCFTSPAPGNFPDLPMTAMLAAYSCWFLVSFIATPSCNGKGLHLTVGALYCRLFKRRLVLRLFQILRQGCYGWISKEIDYF